MSATPTPPSEPPKFEEALRELEQIVRDLEEGELGLDEALARYERGVNLLRQCHQMLQRVERKIELLTGVDEAGNPVCAPLDDAALTLDEKAERRSGRRTAPKLPPTAGGREISVDDPAAPS